MRKLQQHKCPVLKKSFRVFFFFFFLNTDWSISYLNVSARQGRRGQGVSESSIISFQTEITAL